ncbi:hypothetical protein KC19_VG077300 [Ceratodon purpureus]|uniref:Uncharacterized protein n=1 Tax=Ceratodon purpureus TaxID=3225 RepID=A0A8T0HNN6_CERPU|nr:hypothetical protein KC19_VG077300 [Ceratodon purpureus]
MLQYRLHGRLICRYSLGLTLPTRPVLVLLTKLFAPNFVILPTHVDLPTAPGENIIIRNIAGTETLGGIGIVWCVHVLVLLHLVARLDVSLEFVLFGFGDCWWLVRG